MLYDKPVLQLVGAAKGLVMGSDFNQPYWDHLDDSYPDPELSRDVR